MPRAWGRRLTIAAAASLIVIAASMFQLRSHEPAAEQPDAANAAKPVPSNRPSTDLRTQVYAALDALIPKHQYLESERRRHGYRE